MTDDVGSKHRQGDRKRLMEAAVVLAIVLFLIFVMPSLLTAVGQSFRLKLLGRFLALAIAALGIDLIWGYTGLLSLGHGIFFGLGGYAIGMHLKLQIPPGELPDFMGLYGVTTLPWFWRPFYSFPFTLVAIVLIPSLLAGFVGYLVFRSRIKGVYFSILTQAVTIIFFNFFNGQQRLVNGTNGLIDFKTLLGATVSDPKTQFGFYCCTIIVLVAAYALCRWLTSDRFGALLIAIRDDESRTRFLGYDPAEAKTLVFAVSAALAGIAGALYTLQSESISPRSMDVASSIEMVIWVAVGGRATLVGAILGAVLVNFARSLLSEQFPEIWLFFQGALFLLVVLVLPNGIIGWCRTNGHELVLKLLKRSPIATATYPSLEQDLDVQQERRELEPKE